MYTEERKGGREEERKNGGEEGRKRGIKEVRRRGRVLGENRDHLVPTATGIEAKGLSGQ